VRGSAQAPGPDKRGRDKLSRSTRGRTDNASLHAASTTGREDRRVPAIRILLDDRLNDNPLKDGLDDRSTTGSTTGLTTGERQPARAG